MSRAKKLFEAHIENLRRSAKEKGFSLSAISDIVPQYVQEPSQQSPQRSLAEIFEQATIEQARLPFYEWLANVLLDTPGGTQKQRESGVRRGMQKQIEAARRKEKIFACAAELMRQGTPERALNKAVAKRLNEEVGYVRKTLAVINKK